ncbi:tail length tape measure protein [Salmonella phage 35]|uniref:Capsid assembly protein n=2 Tax=Chivirus TaxID=1623283 RepID=A0A0N7CF93_9CAUD|nr:tail length tape measure protein [Salmonella phage 37]YP_009829977.1 tail length tape measure protein [Salmonella phage 35]AKJ73901.1 capsid assembly protein [Salmonella phage 37]AKJ74092.1 capsid assembly protein [Salmonella phage 35]
MVRNENREAPGKRGLCHPKLLMQSCIGAVLNGKKGGKEYKKLIKELSDG